MSIGQVGLLLEIIGFILIGVFAGIILEKNVVGIWADKLNTLTKKTPSILPGSMFWYGLPASRIVAAKTMISSVIVISLVYISLIIIGWIIELMWLTWAGIGLSLIHLILIAIFVKSNHQPTLEGTFLEIPILILDVVFLFIPVLIVGAVSLITAETLINALRGLLELDDIIKKSLIIVGTLMILVGLVFQLYSSF